MSMKISSQQVPQASNARLVRVLGVYETDEVIIGFGAIVLSCFGFGEATSDDVGLDLWASFSAMEIDDLRIWRLDDNMPDTIKRVDGSSRYEIHGTLHGSSVHACGLVIGDEEGSMSPEYDYLDGVRVGIIVDRIDITFHR
ncbi:hypothetical protein IEQ11_21015 [Lysobacter capsici]|uniref:hypothetical protein n=1 Tax=Lysobacter capsici TaxID=435897 RepID=UPI001785A6A9|nr:hypothetical protein [Lysobacter capsici]UOF14181.1 hypothetical protein IEQ11_21015 [Lysobacter capsici]